MVYKISRLEEDLTLKIALIDGVTPNEVTLEYIEKQRNYRDQVLGLPIALMSQKTELAYLTGREIKTIEDKVSTALTRL